MRYLEETGFPPGSSVIHGSTFASEPKEKARVETEQPMYNELG